MIDPFLRVMSHINDWSDHAQVPVSTLVDITGIHGVRIYDKSREKLKGLIESLRPLVKSDGLFLDVHRVRGGTLLAFSRKALSESDVRDLLLSIGEGTNMSFKDRMDAAMHGAIEHRKPAPVKQITHETIDFTGQAKRINEAQYKSATDGMLRSNQSSLARETHGKKISYAGELKRRKRNSEETYNEYKSIRRFIGKIDEALEGMATSDDQQPRELLAKFGEALTKVGMALGGRPIQDRLTELGIQAKTSQDGSEVILFMINAKTQAPQPIARISAESISNPTDFQKAIQDMMDLAEGNEPGATETNRNKLQAREKAIRDVAQSFAPPQDNGAGAAAQAAAPKASPSPM